MLELHISPALRVGKWHRGLHSCIIWLSLVVYECILMSEQVWENGVLSDCCERMYDGYSDHAILRSTVLKSTYVKILFLIPFLVFVSVPISIFA